MPEVSTYEVSSFMGSLRQDRKPYDEARYLMALKEKGSPLVKELAS
jgi:hypothetical protein